MSVVVTVCLLAGCLSACADNLLPESSFTRNEGGGWYFYIAGQVAEAGGSGGFQDGKVVVKVPAMEKPNAAAIQLIRPFEIDPDLTYTVKFKVASDREGKLFVSYALRNAPFTTYGRASVDVKAGAGDYVFPLVVKKDAQGKFDSPRALRLCFGAFTNATVSVSEISIDEAESN